MKFLSLFLGLLTVSMYAGDIFVNGNFKTDRRGQPLLWSKIIGNTASNPHGKMSIKENVLNLEAYQKAVQIHSNRTIRVKKGNKISLTFKVRGKGLLVTGFSCYNHQIKYMFSGQIPVSRMHRAGNLRAVLPPMSRLYR